MDARQFRAALAADPTARIFIDRFAIPSTAHLVEGRWVAHADTTEAGEEIAEARLFSSDPALRTGWQAERDRVSARYAASLLTIELPERLPSTFELGRAIVEPIELTPDGPATAPVLHEIAGERYLCVRREELHRFPGARVL